MIEPNGRSLVKRYIKANLFEIKININFNAKPFDDRLHLISDILNKCIIIVYRMILAKI